jgi:hypothetical protein
MKGTNWKVCICNKDKNLKSQGKRREARSQAYFLSTLTFYFITPITFAHPSFILGWMIKRMRMIGFNWELNRGFNQKPSGQWGKICCNKTNVPSKLACSIKVALKSFFLNSHAPPGVWHHGAWKQGCRRSNLEPYFRTKGKKARLSPLFPCFYRTISCESSFFVWSDPMPLT